MDESKLIFSFHGGDADKNRMDFYDAARFQYGAARLLIKLEGFRQDGQVIRRITSKKFSRFYVEAAGKGSIDFTILAPLLVSARDAFLAVPIDIMVAWIGSKFFPNPSEESLRQQIEQERTKQEAVRQKTEQMKITMEREKNRYRAIETQENLKLLQSMINHQKEQIDRLSESGNAREELLLQNVGELEAMKAREQVLLQYSDQLSVIPKQKTEQLMAELRSPLREIGQPLFNSASYMSFKGEATHSSVLYLDRRMAHGLAGNTRDSTPNTFLGNVFQYNIDTAWGKFKNQAQFRKGIAFYVPAHLKEKLKRSILAAMSEDAVTLIAYPVRNATGQITNLEVIGLADEND